jgi:hypothetical protein
MGKLWICGKRVKEWPICYKMPSRSTTIGRACFRADGWGPATRPIQSLIAPRRADKEGKKKNVYLAASFTIFLDDKRGRLHGAVDGPARSAHPAHPVHPASAVVVTFAGESSLSSLETEIRWPWFAIAWPIDWKHLFDKKNKSKQISVCSFFTRTGLNDFFAVHILCTSSWANFTKLG